ncbi:helix-turn-helix domain-containing protein [Longimicrobium terrae]|nr:helix-turn-helix domain-containing protein [Longimicrobium terrae]NNC32751.1 helix-turn-helix domain-containing protein [Longimicrobium terrae]
MMTVIDIPVPHVLRTAEEYDAAVSEIDRLLDLGAEPFSEDADRLELLSVLVEEYDRRNNPIDDSGLTPQDAVDFMLGQRGMTRADLAELMGGRSRVSEFFSGKRELSRGQIAALRDVLGIPADLLM